MPRKYRWVASTDGVEAGRARKEDPTDQQCQYCGRWFENRGVVGHESGCDFRDLDWLWVDDDGYIRADGRLGSAFEEVEDEEAMPLSAYQG